MAQRKAASPSRLDNSHLLSSNNSSHIAYDRVNHFFDEDFVLEFVGKKLEEARGHRTLLVATTYDTTLRRSALLDGSSISFLFSDVQMANNLKQYIRSLHEDQQDTAGK